MKRVSHKSFVPMSAPNVHATDVWQGYGALFKRCDRMTGPWRLSCVTVGLS
jgi:hypothetical protein